MKKYKQKMSGLLVVMSMAASAEVQWVDQLSVKPLAQINVKHTTLINSNQDRVAFNQSLIGQEYNAYVNNGYVSESKQYWLDTDAQKLSQGVVLPITSNTAIIRVSPLHVNNKSSAIEQQQVELSMKGIALNPSTFANSQQLKATGMSVSDHTVAMKVTAQAGDLMLKVNGLTAGGSDPFTLHVFEPESEHVLSLKTVHQSHVDNEPVVIKASMNDTAGTLPMQINGYITAPGGEKVQDLTFKAGSNGGYETSVSGLHGRSLSNGLWEVHTISETMVDGVKVLRDASSAFAVDLSSAQFDGNLGFEKNLLNVGIDNALAGRYEIRGTLLGHDANKGLQPIALMMTAQWLKAGSQTLAFDWPTDLVESSGLQPPFLIKGVELKNQSLMAPVQRIESGIKLDQGFLK